MARYDDEGGAGKKKGGLDSDSDDEIQKANKVGCQPQNLADIWLF